MAMNGTDILIAIEGDVVGSQRDCSFKETTEKIDISSKDSRAGRWLPGRYGASLNLDMLYVPSDTAYLALQAAMRNGTLVEVWSMELGVIVESANAIVESLDKTAPDQDAALCACALTIDGEWISGS